MWYGKKDKGLFDLKLIPRFLLVTLLVLNLDKCSGGSSKCFEKCTCSKFKKTNKTRVSCVGNVDTKFQNIEEVKRVLKSPSEVASL